MDISTEESTTDDECDYFFKVIILGDADCGKTSLLRRFCYKSFNNVVKTTIGIDFYVCDVKVLNGAFFVRLFGFEKILRFQNTMFQILENFFCTGNLTSI